MALTFKTADLIDIIESLITGQDQAEARYEQACAVARQKHKDDWWSKNKERVRDLRDYLTVSLKRDTPPDHKTALGLMEQGTSYSRDLELFSGGGDAGISRPSGKMYRPDELKGLVELLRAHQLETITAHQLKELGTHPKDLELLFRTAVKRGTTSNK